MIYGEEQLGPRVTDVEAENGFTLKLKFNNGEQKRFDVKPLFELPIYQDLPEVFSEARVEYGTVVWPGNIDISPDTLYLESDLIEDDAKATPGI